MSERFVVERPIYPVIGLCVSMMVLIGGITYAKNPLCSGFLLGIWVLFVLFGYWKACIAIVPVAAVLSLIFGGITYLISKDSIATMAAVHRMFAVAIAVVPGLALSPIVLVRNCATLRMPPMLTLGMMITLTFFPLLGREIKQIRDAMKTRGAGSILRPQIFYRAFLIPLIIRLVNVSDVLALSLETRGFTGELGQAALYKEVTLSVRDVVFLIGCVAMLGWMVIG